MTASFLAGLRVLDMSQYLPGPFAARMLGDFGADVVKVEPPGGEPGRRLDNNGNESVSPYYHIVNAGKRVIEIDLKDPVGRERLEIADGGELRWFESSPGIRRGFCGRCGSSLFWDDSATGSVSIMAGTLDPPTGLDTQCDIFVGDKGDYYAIDGDLPHLAADRET